MTVSTLTTSNSFLGNGVTKVFTFTFRCDSATWVRVYKDGVLQSTGYAVAVNKDQGASLGGTVTFTTAPGSGVVVLVERSTPLTQETDYAAYDSFPAETHELALDKAVLLVQDEARDRADEDAATLASIPAAVVAGATPLISAAVGAEASARAAADAAIIASGAMPANVGIAPVIATGTTQATSVADHLGQFFNVKTNFGAQGDGVTDDFAAIQAAATAAMDAGKGLYFPAGTYLITATVEFSSKNIGNRIFGEGATSIIKWGGSDVEADMFRVWNAHYIHFEDLQFYGLTEQTLVNIRGDVLGHARPDGAGSRGATFINCRFWHGRFGARWTTIDRDYNNEQGMLLNCLFIHQALACISFEHSNSLWHKITNCEFQSQTGSWAINTVDDQGGNSYAAPATYDSGYGGSGLKINGCTLTAGGWLRLGPMRYACYMTDCFSEGNKDFIYTPTNRAKFTGDVASGSATVSNVTNIGQLVAGDYVYGTHIPLGTTIDSIGADSFVMSANATGTKTTGVLDAGVCENATHGRFLLYLERCSGNMFVSTQKTVTPLIAIDLSGTGGSAPFVFSMQDCDYGTTASNTDPMFINPVGNAAILNSVMMGNVTGEVTALSARNAYATASGFLNKLIYLTSDCATVTGGLVQPAGGAQLNNCWVDGDVLCLHQVYNYSTGFRYLPVGAMRSIDAGYPSSDVDIVTMAGLPYGHTITIQFGGKITLKHGTNLVLAGAVDVKPANTKIMQFISRGAGKVTEIYRNF